MATTRMKTVGADAGTSNTTVYTAPNSPAKDVTIVTLRAAHVAGSGAPTYEISVGGHLICKNTPIGVGESQIHAEDGVLFLLPGETIVAKASIAATVHITASIVERDALP